MYLSPHMYLSMEKLHILNQTFKGVHSFPSLGTTEIESD